MPTIAEDLLLVLLDDAKGRFLVARPALDRGVAGALLAELALAGRVHQEDRGRLFAAKLAVDPGQTPDGPALAAALERVARKGTTAVTAVQNLARLKPSLLDASLDPERIALVPGRRVLGVFPTRRYRLVPGPAAQEQRRLREELRAVLVDGVEPTPRTAVLVSVLRALNALRHVAPGGSWRAVNRRAKDLADGEWAGEAVRSAIAATNAAIAATAATSAAVAASGS